MGAYICKELVRTEMSAYIHGVPIQGVSNVLILWYYNNLFT